MEKILLIEFNINILGKDIGVKIFKDNNYTYELSEFLKNEDDMDVYKPGSASIDKDLEGLLAKLNFYKNRFSKIIKSESNPNY